MEAASAPAALNPPTGDNALGSGEGEAAVGGTMGGRKPVAAARGWDEGWRFDEAHLPPLVEPLAPCSVLVGTMLAPLLLDDASPLMAKVTPAAPISPPLLPGAIGPSSCEWGINIDGVPRDKDDEATPETPLKGKACLAPVTSLLPFTPWVPAA